MKTPHNMPNNILTLNKKLENLNTERGKLIMKLSANIEWRKYRFMLFAKDVIGTYITTNTPGKIKIIKDVDMTSENIKVYFEDTVGGLITHKIIKLDNNLPYEADSVFGIIGDGWKRLSEKEAHRFANYAIDLKVKALKEEIKKLESAKTK